MRAEKYSRSCVAVEKYATVKIEALKTGKRIGWCDNGGAKKFIHRAAVCTLS